MNVPGRWFALAALLVLASCDAQPPAAPLPEDTAAAIDRSREARPERWRRKVVLLGFDSCDPDLVDRMIREGKLPNFARMRREGAYGQLETIQPPLSPVVWTSVATGMPPERHGILDFVTDTPQGIQPVSSKMRQADTVWDLLSRCGDTVGVVGWLVTFPAEPVNGFLLTDRMGMLAFDYGKEQDVDAPQRTYPESLAAEVERRDRVTVDDLPLWKVQPFADVGAQEYAEHYATKFHPANPLGNLRLALATAETFRASGQRLLRERRPRFFACYFEMMDALSHLFMRYAPPKLPDVDEAEYLRYRTAIEQNYVWHDTVLGEFMDLADADTTLLLVSDHGFKSGQFRRNDPSDFHAKTGAMWHRPFGVFFAWGNGVARGARVDGAGVLDVAPTVLAAMGYPKPKDMPGRVLEQAFEGGLPHDTVATYFGEERRARLVDEETAAKDAPAATTPEQQAMLEKLRSLGYIGGERSDPSTSLLNLGQRFMATARFEDALEQFETALKKERTPNTLTAVAEALAALGRKDDARKLADEAVSMDPTFVPGQLLLARLELSAGRHDAAESIARAVVEAKPDLPHAWASYAEICEAQRARHKRDGDAVRSESYRQLALHAHEQALVLEPNQLQSRLSIAELLLDEPRDVAGPARAIEHFDKLIERRPEHVLAFVNRAVARLRLGVLAQSSGRPAEARPLLEQAVADATTATDLWRKRSGKEYPKGWANRAYALWYLDRMDEAFAAAQKAREADPEYVFFAPFVAALTASGRTLPPPPAAPSPPR